MAVEMLEGLVQLQAIGILHLGVKPAEILLQGYKHADFATFQLSTVVQTLQSPALPNWAATHYMYVLLMLLLSCSMLHV